MRKMAIFGLCRFRRQISPQDLNSLDLDVKILRQCHEIWRAETSCQYLYATQASSIQSRYLGRCDVINVRIFGAL